MFLSFLSRPARIAALLATGFLAFTSTVFSQSGEGWISLIDGETISNQEPLGAGNWRGEDGAVVVDANAAEGAAFLLTQESYKDFQVYLEFWASEDANSGIFIRCRSVDPSPGSTTCYEVNIYDQRPDPTYGTGAVVSFAEVDPMPKVGGKWNTMEVTAQGRQITVKVNGEVTVDFRNGLFTEGRIGLQYGSGVLKFRKYAIKPL